ncbi:MAG: O-antigen ligase family protein [PVC group bacterium]
MNNFRGKYRLVLWGLLLIVIFFIGVGQVSLNKADGTADSLEQPVFRRSFPSLNWLRFSVGGKIRNLIYPLLVLWAAGCIWDRTLRPPRTALTLPLLVFLSVAVMAYVFSPLRELSWAEGLRELLLGGGFCLAASVSLSSGRNRRAALVVLVIGAGLSALAGLYLFSRGVYFPETPRRIWLSFMHPNSSGSALLLLIPPAVSLATARVPARLRAASGLAALLLSAAMILTFSRTAWISLLIALAVLALYRRGRFYYLAALVLLASLLILGVNVGPQSYFKERLKSFTAFTTDPNIEKRLIYWDGVRRMIALRPVLGYGPGYRVFMASYEKDFQTVETDEQPIHAHNMYLSLGAAAGLAGASAFLWLLAAAFYLLLSGERTREDPFEQAVQRGMTAGLAGFLIGGLADNPFFSFRVMLIFWLFLALIVGRRASPSSSER